MWIPPAGTKQEKIAYNSEIMIPLAYILIRFSLMIVLMKFLITQIRLKRNEKMTRFVRDEKATPRPSP